MHILSFYSRNYGKESCGESTEFHFICLQVGSALRCSILFTNCYSHPEFAFYLIQNILQHEGFREFPVDNPDWLFSTSDAKHLDFFVFIVIIN